MPISTARCLSSIWTWCIRPRLSANQLVRSILWIEPVFSLIMVLILKDILPIWELLLFFRTSLDTWTSTVLLLLSSMRPSMWSMLLFSSAYDIERVPAIITMVLLPSIFSLFFLFFMIFSFNSITKFMVCFSFPFLFLQDPQHLNITYILIPLIQNLMKTLPSLWSWIVLMVHDSLCFLRFRKWRLRYYLTWWHPHRNCCIFLLFLSCLVVAIGCYLLLCSPLPLIVVPLYTFS